MATYVAMAIADNRGLTLWVRQGSHCKAVHYGGKRTKSPELNIEHSDQDLDVLVDFFQTNYPSAIIGLENNSGLVHLPAPAVDGIADDSENSDMPVLDIDGDSNENTELF